MSSDNRRKRLKFRSWHRGTREMDLIMGTFAELHVDHFTDAELAHWEAIIEESDPNLYDWISGKDLVPSHLENDVMALLKQHTLTSTRGTT